MFFVINHLDTLLINKRLQNKRIELESNELLVWQLIEH
jgi:hypothetical protein